MSEQDFSTTVTVDASPTDVFTAVTDVRGWWSAGLEGDSAQVGDEFTYRYEDAHVSRIRVIEADPGRRVAWLVLDNSFSFVQDPTEWVGSEMIFDITAVDGGTELRFTHHGLLPEHECYEACVQGWSCYITDSLRERIASGTGRPNAAGTARTDSEREVAATRPADYSTTITVAGSPDAAFAAISDARGWWSDSIEGSTAALGDEFTFHVPGVHWSRHRVAEAVPGKRIVWDVLDARLEFVEDKTEWVGTQIVFDLGAGSDETTVRFTHIGLVPEYECFDTCASTWGRLMSGSLKRLIVNGEGRPFSGTSSELG